MLSELRTAHKVIGVKQSKKAIRDGAAAQVFVALDAEKRVVGPIYELCSEHGMEVTEVTTMTELGDAVGISRIKAQIIRAAALECHSLFHSEHDNIGHQLYGDKIIPGIPDRRLGYKAPLAAAKLHPQRLVGLAEHMRRIGGKQVRTRSETALAVTFFSYSHIAIYSVI